MPENINDLDEQLYQELRKLANILMQKERSGHTLSPTDLVHNAYLKLSHKDLNFSDKKHYYRTLAQQMKRLLIDYGRQKQTDKHEGALHAASYTDSFGLSEEPLDMQVLQASVNALEAFDERSHEIIELVYFAAVPVIEVAELMNLSVASVERDLKFGRAYINDYIYNQC